MFPKNFPQGLKPTFILGIYSARLKPCPDTKLVIKTFKEGLWYPTLAPDHPTDEDLSVGTPVSRKDGARDLFSFFPTHSGP